MVVRATVVLIAIALVSAEALAGAEPTDCQCSDQGLEDSSSATARSRSLGWPWHGRLVDGVKLRETRNLRYTPVDSPRGNFWGTRQLVSLIERAAHRVASQAPGALLTVGELSKQRGGNIIGHSSHENGRDVDLGFFLHDEAGVAVSARSFINVNRRGVGHLDEETSVRFDDARNWLLVHALITDPEVTVQHIFVHRSLRRRVLREAERQHVSAQTIARAERIVMSPHTRHPHRNHFHVRIYCAAQDVPRCRDRGPYWPWLPQAHPFRELIPPFQLQALHEQGAIAAAELAVATEAVD